MKRLHDKNKSYFATRAVLIRALNAAEIAQSRLSQSEMAKAFANIGEQLAAAMIRGRISVSSAEPQDGSSPQATLWRCR